MRILLDTNAFIRHADGALPRRVLRFVEKPGTDVLISVVTPWEIAMKPTFRSGGFSMKRVREQIELLNARLLTITLTHIDRVDGLPLLHDDPFDRMIIAQALTEDCTVVSSDRRFPLYKRAGLKVVWDE